MYGKRQNHRNICQRAKIPAILAAASAVEAVAAASAVVTVVAAAALVVVTAWAAVSEARVTADLAAAAVEVKNSVEVDSGQMVVVAAKAFNLSYHSRNVNLVFLDLKMPQKIHKYS